MEETFELVESVANPVALIDDTDLLADIEEVRDNYKFLIKQGKKGLEIAFNMVEGSEHPRAVETFAGLISTLTSVNEKLVALQKTKREVKVNGGVIDPGLASVTNNHVYVGSPADLQKIIDGTK